LTLSKWKYPRRTVRIAAMVFIVVTTSINFNIVKNFSFMMAEFPAYDILYRVGNVTLILLTARFLVKMRASQRFFAAVTVGICVFALDTVAITIRILFGIYPLELLFEFLIYPLMLFLIIKIRKPFIEIMDYMKNRLWPLSMISIFLLICLFSQISVPQPLEHAPENIPAALMICGISAAVYGLVFFLFKTLHRQIELSERIQQHERELTDSRVSIMLSQIQPHFLYNALSAIAQLCDDNPEKAKKATMDFSVHLRSNMESLNEKGLVNINQEISHVKGYLDLEKAMYGDALTVLYHIEADGFLLPPLTIQPLAENAVKHGIGQNEGGGTVSVSVRETENSFCVAISDDGAGYGADNLRQSKRKGIGIENVRRRLEEQCGGTLEISGEPGKGTTALIMIPKKKP
jgi:sensor histidine kinase YesM